MKPTLVPLPVGFAFGAMGVAAVAGLLIPAFEEGSTVRCGRGPSRFLERAQVSFRSSFTSHISTDARVPGVSEESIALKTAISRAF
ncbi:MAG: hypothetical protein ACJ75T_01890 [Solirubrobacterales bacterium]